MATSSDQEWPQDVYRQPLHRHHLHCCAGVAAAPVAFHIPPAPAQVELPVEPVQGLVHPEVANPRHPMNTLQHWRHHGTTSCNWSMLSLDGPFMFCTAHLDGSVTQSYWPTSAFSPVEKADRQDTTGLHSSCTQCSTRPTCRSSF